MNFKVIERYSWSNKYFQKNYQWFKLSSAYENSLQVPKDNLTLEEDSVQEDKDLIEMHQNKEMTKDTEREAEIATAEETVLVDKPTLSFALKM